LNSQTLSTAQLLAKYDRPGPRYTSYPTAVEFSDGFTEADFRQHLAAADALGSEQPLALYVHLPFCEERCLFCGCTSIITKHQDIAERYLDHVVLELDLLAAHLPHRRRVSQYHWGGGTPTHHPPADLERLFAATARHFEFTPDAEIAVEVDPRVTSHEHVVTLRKLGFNRMSMGVQDFDASVQQAVHRVQSYDLTKGLVDDARAAGFASVNIDLIFGLPEQTLDGFRSTLEQVVTIRPERVAVYSFAYVPWMKGHQRWLDKGSLPDAGLKFELIAAAIDAFTGAGYRQLGMDHFAVPEDELSRAVESGRLHRNFMGYTVQSARDMVGAGISSISDVQGAYAQNVKKLPEYFQSVTAGRFPIERGRRLDADDALRRHVITQIMCNFHLDMRDVERRFGIVFRDYFAKELAKLTGDDSPVSHGLLEAGEATLDVTPRGRLFVRNVCMAFDRYLEAMKNPDKPAFSRTV
jgi:oxygen-independent coproporphyrinogen III oxidase